MKKILFYVIAIIITYIIYNKFSPDQNHSSSSPVEPREKSASEIFQENLKLESSWRLNGFGNVFMLSGTIENKNPTRAADVMVRCTTYGQTNSALNRVSHIFRVYIEPDQVYSFKDVNMGIVDKQSQRANCRILTF
ncbi:hypothetical protein QWY20_13265 [Alkalimonas sp. MEB108]|uniref:Lipoprotein n=1 Tax=Alkalimonas cellulosilytica TaxID=3058395 RepID=A0ABU7J7I6_9GAMM|nr:hypothetical protein [Alkalimonas sp. MEB108]MEE2002427.1 hypothetical protein [Alkalimonas sp. MEB108]